VNCVFFCIFDILGKVYHSEPLAHRYDCFQMKLHQVLTGACNAGDRCFAVGSVEGIPFVTYAAGSNIVVLSVTFERVQIIPGICHQNVQISCIDCSTDTGKIAAAYGNKVKVFEPTPLVHHNSTHVSVQFYSLNFTQ
jgi:hypothetical protein